MNIELLYTFGSVIIVSLVSLVGIVTLSLRKDVLKKGISFLVALAIGSLLGDALIHLIPEALAEAKDPSIIPLFVIVGFMLFFLLEKYFHWHHGTHGSEEHTHDCDDNKPKQFGRLIIVSDALHNLIDGMVIAASYFVSIEVGIATTIAIFLHEIPQEIADFGILIHSGYTRTRALFLNFISALFAILGAVLALLLGGVTEELLILLLPIAAGAFIYIASSDLTPELHKHDPKTKNTLLQLAAIILGVTAMWGLQFIEVGSHGHGHETELEHSLEEHHDHEEDEHEGGEHDHEGED